MTTKPYHPLRKHALDANDRFLSPRQRQLPCLLEIQLIHHRGREERERGDLEIQLEYIIQELVSFGARCGCVGMDGFVDLCKP